MMMMMMILFFSTTGKPVVILSDSQHMHIPNIFIFRTILRILAGFKMVVFEWFLLIDFFEAKK